MNFLKSIVNKIKNGVCTVVEKVESVIVRTQVVLASSTAENYVDSGLKILIAVVIGALLLTGIYKLFNTTIMPTVTSKVTELFNYNG